MNGNTEQQAIELYLSEDLPHDRDWSDLSESTRQGYRQRVSSSETAEEK